MRSSFGGAAGGMKELRVLLGWILKDRIISPALHR